MESWIPIKPDPDGPGQEVIPVFAWNSGFFQTLNKIPDESGAERGLEIDSKFYISTPITLEG
jgi:hypothetical protein